MKRYLHQRLLQQLGTSLTDYIVYTVLPVAYIGEGGNRTSATPLYFWSIIVQKFSEKLPKRGIFFMSTPLPSPHLVLRRANRIIAVPKLGRTGTGRRAGNGQQAR